MLRERLSPPPTSFPAAPWALLNVELHAGSEDFVGQVETMFALSNGYLGLRGTFVEGVPAGYPGVFLNGFFEYRPISYGEHAYGFPRRGQTMLNCPDGTIIKLLVDDEPFIATISRVLTFSRILDFRDGLERREVEWRTERGHSMRLVTGRLVSLADRNLVAIKYELTALDADVDITVSSEIRKHEPLTVDTSDPRLAVGQVGKILQDLKTECAGSRATLSCSTLSSELGLICGIDHSVDCPSEVTSTSAPEEDGAAIIFNASLAPGKTFHLIKYVGYHHGARGNVDQYRTLLSETLNRAVAAGFEPLIERQRRDLQQLWDHVDIRIGPSDPRLQQVIRWNIFQLIQASARCEGHGIGARGLTGQTYEGHYFWDTEIYVLPFLIYQMPQIARSLLKFRYDGLEKARARARELGHRGATFPWRTINGEEASAYYAAGTAQYHINADIAYAIRKYVDNTGDEEFLREFGAEIVIETARFWWDIGFFSRRRQGQFCINGVTGPDEYTAIVNNNYFTNLMARENLNYAVETARWLQREHPEFYLNLVERLGLEETEITNWEEAANRMYLPYDNDLDVHPQDDSFLDKEVWNFANTPPENYPLLLHYHPLNLYRSQVIKQADILMAMFLVGDRFTAEEKKRNFDYYDPITTDDSSLSVCIQSIIANEIGYRQKAWHYFRFAAVMDLSDVGGNMKYGVHIAAAGGTWLALTHGFAGMKDHRGRISFNPCLPDHWDTLDFSLLIRGSRLEVRIGPHETSYRLLYGPPLVIYHTGSEVSLSESDPLQVWPTPRHPSVEPESEDRVVDPKIEQ